MSFESGQVLPASECLAVRAENHGLDSFGMSFEGGEFLARRHVPETCQITNSNVLRG